MLQMFQNNSGKSEFAEKRLVFMSMENASNFEAHVEKNTHQGEYLKIDSKMELFDQKFKKVLFA